MKHEQIIEGAIGFHIPEGFEALSDNQGRRLILPSILDVQGALEVARKVEKKISETRERIRRGKEFPGDISFVTAQRDFRICRNKLIGFLSQQNSPQMYVILISRSEYGDSYQFAVTDDVGNTRDFCCISGKFLKDIPEEFMLDDETNNEMAQAVSL